MGLQNDPIVSPLGPSRELAWAKWATQVMAGAAQVASLPFEVLLRRQMGVRYVTGPAVIASLILIGVFGFTSGQMAKFTQAIKSLSLQASQSGDEPFARAPNRRDSGTELPDFDPAFVLVEVIFIVAVLAQGTLIGIRQRKGIRCHSRYGGDSWDFWARIPFYPGQYYWQFYCEPLGIVLTGVPVLSFNIALGYYCFAGGVGLFLKHYIAHRKFMNSVLDAMDAEIESRWTSEYMSGWHETGAVETEGFVVPPFVMKQTSEEKLHYFATTAKLHPSLQQLLRDPNRGEQRESAPPWNPWAGTSHAPEDGDGGTDDPPPDPGGPPPGQPPPRGPSQGGGGSLMTGDGPKLPTLPPWNPSGGGGAAVAPPSAPVARSPAPPEDREEGPPKPRQARPIEDDPKMNERGFVTHDRATGEFRFEPIRRPKDEKQ